MKEPYLADPKETIRVIRQHQFQFQKKFGQNFLIDAHVIEKILRAADIGAEDFVVEIGPGIGTLTQYLASRARGVAAVEIDRMLLPILEETLDGFPNVTVICDDILRVDIAALSDKYNGGRPVKLVANLPYYITTPILMQLLERRAPVESMTVMVQREVAARMMQKPGVKEYGALSLAVQYYAEMYLAANVPQNCFLPRPSVDSAVVRLTPYKEPPVAVKDEALMFRLIRASFNQRRKTLVNGLANGAGLSLTKEALVQILSGLGLPADVRGEALALAQFAQLADAIQTSKSQSTRRACT